MGADPYFIVDAERIKQALAKIAAAIKSEDLERYRELMEQAKPKRLPKPPMARREIRFNPACSQKKIWK